MKLRKQNIFKNDLQLALGFLDQKNWAFYLDYLSVLYWHMGDGWAMDWWGYWEWLTVHFWHRFLAIFRIFLNKVSFIFFTLKKGNIFTKKTKIPIYAFFFEVRKKKNLIFFLILKYFYKFIRFSRVTLQEFLRRLMR